MACKNQNVKCKIAESACGGWLILIFLLSIMTC